MTRDQKDKIITFVPRLFYNVLLLVGFMIGFALNAIFNLLEWAISNVGDRLSR